MIRSSKHILKYQTKSKSLSLEKLFEDYRLCLEYYIGLILEEKISLKKFVSSKDLPNMPFTHSNWKSCVYIQASGIVKSCLKKHKNLRFKRYKKVYKVFKENLVVFRPKDEFEQIHRNF